MASIYDWSLTASENDDADAIINWLEGQFPSTVNDSARAMMQRIAEFIRDIGGGIAAAGTANALTLTASSGFSSLADGIRVSFKAAASNTGAATINVNGLGSKPIRKQQAGGDVDIAANDVRANGIYEIVYSTDASAGTGGWLLRNPSGDGFASGTRILFSQTTAPTGWTKDTTHNNKALRVVSGTIGSGGTVDFTSAFTTQTVSGTTSNVTVSGTVGGTALTIAQIPSHSHSSGTLAGTTNTTGAHTHTLETINIPGNGTNLDLQVGTNGSYISKTTSSAGNHSHTVSVNSGSTGSQGSGATHNHSFSGDAHSHTFSDTVDLAVKYVDAIIAEKD